MKKLSEEFAVFPAGVWVPAADFRKFCGVGLLDLADGGEGITVQLRKATDANGTGATNFGAAATVTHPGTSPAANDLIRAFADGRADELGLTGGGVQYTHVSVTVTDTSTPEVGQAVLIAGDARYFVSTLAGALRG